ncbi:DUF2227 family putative metal-binding protein [Nodosilinea sp. FACHB-131]|uniref:DUF2227 family putative metal-binding protein n=1 Tax=Cyanophyceae TaxID=3028117 RepID=UPI0016829179|nr:DUF2227 family putative metal-binding protein [Nodosilinea sp. FACHB-131]MBD1871974.1 DUF2227 family putative metal-binding protein [Nodosilinea sp. FACHB-131]
MTTPLRLIFGGSNRQHHLRMSMTLTSAIAATGYYYAYDLWPLWLTTAAACYGQEAWATADRDVEPSRKPPCLYWLPYGHIVKHRGLLSHGLVIGTVVRLAYGWWPMLWLLWNLLPALAVAWCVGALINDLGHLALDL